MGNDYNHSTALNHGDHVQHHLDTEVKHPAICGLYDAQLIEWLNTSPLLSMHNSDHRQIIVDLSWPEGGAVKFFSQLHHSFEHILLLSKWWMLWFTVKK